MVSPGLALPPLIVGVLSEVILSVLLLPVSLVAATSAKGADGAVVSIVTGTVVGAEVLPAGSVAVTMTFCRPSGKGLVGVTFQIPLDGTITVCTSPPGKVTVMVSPATAVPLMVGVLSLVILSLLLMPVSLTAATSANGAAGAAVSMVIANGAAGPSLPAGSVAVIVRLFRPSASGVVVALQLPLASTIAVAIGFLCES